MKLGKGTIVGAAILAASVGAALAVNVGAVEAQVPLEESLRKVTMDGRTVLLARFPVRNPTALVWRVDVGKVYQQIPNDTTVVLGAEVAARTSPKHFTLEPGAAQIVAVMIEWDQAGAGYHRVEITVTDGEERMSGAQGGVRAALVMATRYLVKLGIAHESRRPSGGR